MRGVLQCNLGAWGACTAANSNLASSITSSTDDVLYLSYSVLRE